MAKEVHCIRCDYNLRGLHPETRCPECGLDIQASMDVYSRGRETRWIRRIMLGIAIATLSYVLSLLHYLVWIVEIFSRTLQRIAPSQPISSSDLVNYALILEGAVLVVSVLIMFKPPPSGSPIGKIRFERYSCLLLVIFNLWFSLFPIVPWGAVRGSALSQTTFLFALSSQVVDILFVWYFVALLVSIVPQSTFQRLVTFLKTCCTAIIAILVSSICLATLVFLFSFVGPWHSLCPLNNAVASTLLLVNSIVFWPTVSIIWIFLLSRSFREFSDLLKTNAGESNTDFQKSAST